MAFHAALIVYLESGKLVEWHEAADILGSKEIFFIFFFFLKLVYSLMLIYLLVTTDREKGFHLDLEDFLMGLLNLGPEMVRFIF